MRGERILLDTALHQTNDEQLLINLVRLRYGDTPAFLQVSSISSQLAFEVGIDGGIELERNETNTDLFSFGGNAGYATRPTLSYLPLQGNEFIQQLLTPLTVEKILLLYRSGWHIKRLFTVCFQRMNELKNAPRASGPTIAVTGFISTTQTWNLNLLSPFLPRFLPCRPEKWKA